MPRTKTIPTHSDADPDHGPGPGPGRRSSGRVNTKRRSRSKIKPGPGSTSSPVGWMRGLVVFLGCVSYCLLFFLLILLGQLEIKCISKEKANSFAWEWLVVIVC